VKIHILKEKKEKRKRCVFLAPLSTEDYFEMRKEEWLQPSGINPSHAPDHRGHTAAAAPTNQITCTALPWPSLSLFLVK
jgi:hypothetical protein